MRGGLRPHPTWARNVHISFQPFWDGFYFEIHPGMVILFGSEAGWFDLSNTYTNDTRRDIDIIFYQ